MLSPEGVQEDWSALYRRLERTSQEILARQVSLQGRSLLVNSKLLGRLWYKCRLSSPTRAQIGRFTQLAWSTIWNQHTALVLSQAIGRRRRRAGGLGFLQPQAEISALLAQWIPAFLLRPTLWTPIFQHAFAQQRGSLANLYSQT